MTSQKITSRGTRLLCTLSLLVLSFSIVAVSSNALAKSETNSKIKKDEKRISRILKAGARSIKKECGIKKVKLDYKLIQKLPLAKKMDDMGRVAGIIGGAMDSLMSVCGDSDVQSRLGLFKSFNMTFTGGGTWRVKTSGGKISVSIGIKQPGFSGLGKMLKKRMR